MSTSYSTLAKTLNLAVQSLHARPDYTKSEIDIDGQKTALTGLAASFNALKQACLNAKAGGETVTDAQLSSTDAQVQALVNANIAIANMGQLSTAKTITGQMALTQNKLLSTLSSQIMEVRAGGGSGDDDKPVAYIAGIEIVGMKQLSDDTVSLDYEKNKSALVSARIEPWSKEAEAEIEWSGVNGNPPAIPRGELTSSGKPLVITAKLGGFSRSLNVYVLPQLEQLKVTGAEEKAEDGVYDASKATKLTIRAITIPDTSAAWTYLKWSGGQSKGGSLNLRTINPQDYAGLNYLPVTAWVEPPDVLHLIGQGGKS